MPLVRLEREARCEIDWYGRPWPVRGSVVTIDSVKWKITRIKMPRRVGEVRRFEVEAVGVKE